MLSNAHRFIFLHVPRTGGNSIQSYLLPLSEEGKQIRGKQDSINTFEIARPVTPHNHATLSDYAAVVQLSDYKIAISVRHPIDRALSLYFAPIRVLSGARAAQAPFELHAFNTMVRDMRPMADFVRIGEGIEMPRLVLRYEHGVSANMVRLAQFLGLPTPENVGHLNAWKQINAKLFNAILGLQGLCAGALRKTSSSLGMRDKSSKSGMLTISHRLGRRCQLSIRNQHWPASDEGCAISRKRRQTFLLERLRATRRIPARGDRPYVPSEIASRVEGP